MLELKGEQNKKQIGLFVFLFFISKDKLNNRSTTNEVMRVKGNSMLVFLFELKPSF